MALITRNVLVKGRQTCIALEPSIWKHFERMCRQLCTTIPLFIEDIDRTRGEVTRASTIRVQVLEYFAALAESSLSDLVSRRRAIIVDQWVAPAAAESSQLEAADGDQPLLIQ